MVCLLLYIFKIKVKGSMGFRKYIGKFLFFRFLGLEVLMILIDFLFSIKEG